MVKIEIGGIEIQFERGGLWLGGPWGDEPSRVEWLRNGVPCLARRHPQMGHWLGYVGVFKRSKLYGLRDCLALDQAAHMGITWTGTMAGHSMWWWFGFDCGHHGDLCPSGVATDAARADHKHDISTAAASANPPGTSNAGLCPSVTGVYRDIRYVVERVEAMADVVLLLAPPPLAGKRDVKAAAVVGAQ